MDKDLLRKRMKEIRKQRHLTQAEMAKRLSITPSGYGNYEQGVSTPDIETINKIAEIFGMNVDELLNGVQENRPNTIVFFGRGEGKKEFEVTDEEMAVLQNLIETMKNKPDKDNF